MLESDRSKFLSTSGFGIHPMLDIDQPTHKYRHMLIQEGRNIFTFCFMKVTTTKLANTSCDSFQECNSVMKLGDEEHLNVIGDKSLIIEKLHNGIFCVVTAFHQAQILERDVYFDGMGKFIDPKGEGFTVLDWMQAKMFEPSGHCEKRCSISPTFREREGLAIRRVPSCEEHAKSRGQCKDAFDRILLDLEALARSNLLDHDGSLRALCSFQ